MRVIHEICRKITRHKYRKGIAYSVGVPTKYYYRCRVCGFIFWNRQPLFGAQGVPQIDIDKAKRIAYGVDPGFRAGHCHWCDQDITETDVRVNLNILDDDGSDIFVRENIEYKFCPICGRKVDW